MAELWNIVGKASNLVQLLGLDVFTLITIAMSFLRLREIKKECRKLEERVRLLGMALCTQLEGTPVLECGCSACWILTQQQYLEMVTTALRDAQGLVASYNESTLFLRIRRCRSMARQFQDVQSRIDYYCGLVLAVNACLLFVQANPPPPVVR